MSKILYLPFLLFAAYSFSCKPRESNDCQRFRTGKFILRSKRDNTSSIIERDDSLQTEIKHGDTTKARVKWINDCEYELTYLAVTVNSRETINQYVQSHPLRTKILKTGKVFYVFESSVEGMEMKLIDTLRIYQP